MEQAKQSRSRSNKLSEEQRVNNFFKESEKIPFENIPTTLIVGVVGLQPGTDIDTKVLFDNVPIYDIPGWIRGKNKKIDIPHPGVPYVVLSAKSGRNTRGVVKNLGDLAKQGGKGKFPNQVALDISLKDKNVNVFVFPNRLKVTGAQKPEHLIEAFVFIKSILLYMQRTGLPVFKQTPTVVKVELEMENVVFNLGYRIRKDALLERALAEGLFCPQESDAIRIAFPMGKKKKKGDEERYYTFRIHHTGAVVYSGDSRPKMKESYDKFMDFITRNEADIRFV